MAYAPLKPTDKQVKLIADMQKRLKIPFEGETRKDATAYISEHMEEFRLYVKEGYVFGKKKARKNK